MNVNVNVQLDVLKVLQCPLSGVEVARVCLAKRYVEIMRHPQPRDVQSLHHNYSLLSMIPDTFAGRQGYDPYFGLGSRILDKGWREVTIPGIVLDMERPVREIPGYYYGLCHPLSYEENLTSL